MAELLHEIVHVLANKEISECKYIQSWVVPHLCTLPASPQDFPWIVADEQEVHMQEPRLIPLKTMTSDIVKVSRNSPSLISSLHHHHLYFLHHNEECFTLSFSK